MPEIEEEIRVWLHARPDWLQQAAEALLQSGPPNESEIGAIAARLKTPEGQRATANRAFSQLASAQAVSGDLRLVQVGDISGIENLAPRNPLAFGTGNLCVIYGHNGSGKSGYTRLLKKACGKPRARDLEANAFQPPPSDRKCRIEFRVAGETRQIEWTANSAPIEDLRAVDIFDSDVALTYLTEETTASYTPSTVAFFEELVTACDRIREHLQREQDLLVSALPTLPQEYRATPTGIVYGSLRASSTEEVLRDLTLWRDEDDRALARLNERLSATDASLLARNKRSARVQIDGLLNLTQNATAALSAERIAAVRALRDSATSRRQIAIESAQVASAKLDGVGTETWRALWAAARAYSQTAYPDSAFPVVDDALCVLCHQELEPAAQGRLRDFESFVTSTLEAEARAAELAYQAALEGLPEVLSREVIATRCQAASLTDSVLIEGLLSCWDQVSKTREALRASEQTERASAVVVPVSLIGQLTALSEALENEAVQHDTDATDFDRNHATAEKLNLEARQWTSQQRDGVRSEVARLRLIAEYDSWKRGTNTRSISTKAGEISERVITQAYVDRFNRELKVLGASRIQVELVRTRTDHGRALHKLQLKGVQSGQGLPASVLSDGERRIVGLAAFLADVVDQPHIAPFVFDDPISSLDHDFEWGVALRLADLAQSRQVLVLTHRLSLYGAMEDAAKKLGKDFKERHLHQHCIESFAGAAGHPVEQATWNANTKTANNLLLTRLDVAKRAGEASGAAAYKILAQGICSDFRKLLERTVEDDLLNQVVRRHRRSITTDGRLAELSLISRDDCGFIDDLMTKYSTYEHSQSFETPSFIPEEPELRGDLQALKGWREAFKTRQVGANA